MKQLVILLVVLNYMYTSWCSSVHWHNIKSDWRLPLPPLPLPQGMRGTDIMQMLEGSERLDRPEKCPQPVYEIMLRCWSWRPEDRLSFAELVPAMSEIAKFHMTSSPSVRPPPVRPPRPGHSGPGLPPPRRNWCASRSRLVFLYNFIDGRKVCPFSHLLFPFSWVLHREREKAFCMCTCVCFINFSFSLSLLHVHAFLFILLFSLPGAPPFVLFFSISEDRIIIFIQYFLLLSYCPIPHSDFLFPWPLPVLFWPLPKTLFPFTLLLLLLLSYCSYAVPLRISLTLA